MKLNKLKSLLLGRGFVADTGTHDSLIEAGKFIETIEKRQGFKVACLEEIAYRKGYITKKELSSLGELYNGNEYGEYILKLCKNEI